ncbi:MAG: UDP-glucose 4-epimerase GalE [Sutterellaceae bacterium]|nr:UDP-glucose 4-epimerase GalE [Sutterellaceae bacterium]
MRVLLTGGMGFIGSHTAVELIETGHTPVIFDNLCNSSPDVLDAIESITGVKPDFVQGDIRDKETLRKALNDFDIESVIHFAGLKAVGESCVKPLAYYDNNVNGTLVLLEAMRETGVTQLIFSSSATVYGTPQYLPLTEAHPVGAGITNPYGRTKCMIEEILSDLCKADAGFTALCLRYFNPIGAHASGLIGENPNGIPNNLMPYVARVASGALQCIQVFGNDYDTVDGTGVRDYIHVCDLAAGHVAALEKAQSVKGWHAVNLGTGRGTSVLEMVHAFEKACGKTLTYKIVDRRAGDVAACWADCQKAKDFLGWQAKLCLEEMCASAWNFEEKLRAKAKS